MRIELRKSGGETCVKCGSHEVLYVPALAQRLETDVREMILADVPRWRILKKRRQRQLVAELHRASSALRGKTRFPVS